MKQAIAFARKLARTLGDKKADDVRILDVRKLSGVSDFFVFASGASAVHNRAMAEELRAKLKGSWKLHHIEGIEGGDWILLDFVEIIVHIFLSDAREYYGLEELWGDAKEVKYA